MWVAIPFGCLALAVLLHGIAMRLPLRGDTVLRFLMVGAPIGAALVLWALHSGLTSASVAAVMLYAFLCELYIFFFTLVIGSVSVATLAALREREVTEDEFLHRTDTTAMVQVRLARLVKNGFIVRNDDRYALTQKGARVHRAFTRLRWFFRHNAQPHE